MPRRGARSEPLQLRKNEPHPVAALAPGGELSQHAGVHTLLGRDEAREVVGIVHGVSSNSVPRSQECGQCGLCVLCFAVCRVTGCRVAPWRKTITKRSVFPTISP